MLLAYLTILAVLLSGFVGAKPWVVAAAAIALSSLSAYENRELYDRARRSGLFERIDVAVLGSIWNAVLASGAAYGIGWLFRSL
jgi:hypothetical protein